MNGMWGYKVVDQNYKSTKSLVQYLVSTAAKGANLLLNVGPQPNGELPAAAVQRMREMGEWMAKNGDSVYGTVAGDVPQYEWGCTTRKGDRLFVHIFELDHDVLYLPYEGKVVSAKALDGGEKIKFKSVKGGILLEVGKLGEDNIDYVVELTTK
jgi:alpha-L-fucosidase